MKEKKKQSGHDAFQIHIDAKSAVLRIRDGSMALVLIYILNLLSFMRGDVFNNNVIFGAVAQQEVLLPNSFRVAVSILHSRSYPFTGSHFIHLGFLKVLQFLSLF